MISHFPACTLSVANFMSPLQKQVPEQKTMAKQKRLDTNYMYLTFCLSSQVYTPRNNYIHIPTGENFAWSFPIPFTACILRSSSWKAKHNDWKKKMMLECAGIEPLKLSQVSVLCMHLTTRRAIIEKGVFNEVNKLLLLLISWCFRVH